MKILAVDHPIVMSDIVSRLGELGHNVFTCGRDEAIRVIKDRGPVDLVFDVQTGPELNEYCASEGIGKVCWLVDWVINPHAFRRLSDTDGILLLSPFKGLIPRFAAAGYKHVHYFPPGANINRLRFGNTGEVDVVFIGDPISSAKYEYPALLADCEQMTGELNEKGRAALEEFISRLERIIEEQMKTPGDFTAPELVERDPFIRGFPLYQEYYPESFPYMLGKEATSRLRVGALEALTGHNLEIYGPPAWLDFPKLAPCYKGGVGYEHVARTLVRGKVTVNVSRVFNLAICRVMEAASVGTLLITEEREGTDGLFEPGAEIVTYKSVEEIGEHVERYLADNSGRAAITKSARARVERDYDMDKLLPGILEMAMDRRSKRQ